MDIGIHFMNFTLPGGSPAIAKSLGDTAVIAEQSGCQPAASVPT